MNNQMFEQEGFFIQECKKYEDNIKRDLTITEREQNAFNLLEEYRNNSLLDNIMLTAETSIAHVNNNILYYFNSFNSLNGLKLKLKRLFKASFKYYYLLEGVSYYDLKKAMNKSNIAWSNFDGIMEDFINEFYNFEDIKFIVENYDKKKYLDFLNELGCYDTLEKNKKNIIQAVLYECYQSEFLDYKTELGI